MPLTPADLNAALCLHQLQFGLRQLQLQLSQLLLQSVLLLVVWLWRRSVTTRRRSLEGPDWAKQVPAVLTAHHFVLHEGDKNTQVYRNNFKIMVKKRRWGRVYVKKGLLLYVPYSILITTMWCCTVSFIQARGGTLLDPQSATPASCPLRTWLCKPEAQRSFVLSRNRGFPSDSASVLICIWSTLCIKRTVSPWPCPAPLLLPPVVFLAWCSAGSRSETQRGNLVMFDLNKITMHTSMCAVHNEETPADLFVFSYDCCGFLDFQLCFFQLPPEHLLQLGQQEQDVKIILLKWQTNEKDVLTVHNDTTEAFNSATWPGFALLEPASNHRLVTHMWSLTATKLGFFIYWVCWCVTGSLLPITQKENQP